MQDFPSNWIAIYMPLLVVLIISMQQRDLALLTMARLRRKKAKRIMTNELLASYVGKTCKVSTGSYGTSLTGKITRVQDNWLELETKKGIELVNAEYIQNVKVLYG